MTRDLLAVLESRMGPDSKEPGPIDDRARALRAILSPRENETLSSDLIELLFGDRLVARVEDRPEVACPVNVTNFVWGLNVLAQPAGDAWLVWNLANLGQELGTLDAARLLQAIEELSRHATGQSWFVRLAQGAVARRLAPAPAIGPIFRPLVVTIPAFNAPDSLAALLDGLRANAELFRWSGFPVVVFDASSDPAAAEQIAALVSSLGPGRLSFARVGQDIARPKQLPAIRAFATSHSPGLTPEEAFAMFNPSVGGSLNVCFSYFGPDVTVLNLDHDVLPSVEIPEESLATLQTSHVSTAGEIFRLEIAGREAAGRRLPVDLMWFAPRAGTAYALPALTGSEIVEGDDESYKLIRREDGPTPVAEYTVGHIAGVQDHSARFLIDSVLDRGISMRNAAPPRFTPAQPLLAANVRSSKLISTTLTLRRPDLGTPSLGFVGTSVRVQDFLTGSFLRVLGGRPVFWAPVYLTHNRRYGLRGETQFGHYLLNEDFMNVFLKLMTRLEQLGPAPSLEQLHRHWEAATRCAPLDRWIDEFMADARNLEARIRRRLVDETYEAVADSVRSAYGLDASNPQAHRDTLGREIARVTAHLAHRPLVNQTGRRTAPARLAALMDVESPPTK